MQLGEFGQPRAQRLCEDLFVKHKLAGSFLFEGPAGVGKEACAVELGRLLNCERDGGCEPRGLFRPRPVADDGPACSSCRRFRSLQHPDLHLLFPVPTGFWEAQPKPDFELPEAWREREFTAVTEVLQAKARDPYFKPFFERPVGIQAETLRDVVLPAVQRRPTEARMKVVILSDAEQMAFGIGNLLLKTLEEPPPDCLLVLTSSVPRRLLPTLRSRCQRLVFTPLQPDWMVPRLELLHATSSAEARTAAFLSQGSMLAAGRYLTGMLQEVRERALAILRAAAKCDAFELLQLAHGTTKAVSGQRQKLPLLLQILASLARDALLLAEDAAGEPGPAPAAARGRTARAQAPARLVHQDRVEDLRALSRGFDSPGLRRIVGETQRAERQIAGYAHGELTLAALFLGLARESTAARALAARP